MSNMGKQLTNGSMGNKRVREEEEFSGSKKARRLSSTSSCSEERGRETPGDLGKKRAREEELYGSKKTQRLNSSSSSSERVEEEESDDDCVILPGNPTAKKDTAEKVEAAEAKQGEDDDDEDVVILGEKGPVACRDFAHARHDCIKFKFKASIISDHHQHCEKCFCYVCDCRAPCSEWRIHCHATNKEFLWKALRTAARIARNGGVEEEEEEEDDWEGVPIIPIKDIPVAKEKLEEKIVVKIEKGEERKRKEDEESDDDDCVILPSNPFDSDATEEKEREEENDDSDAAEEKEREEEDDNSKETDIDFKKRSDPVADTVKDLHVVKEEAKEC